MKYDGGLSHEFFKAWDTEPFAVFLLASAATITAALLAPIRVWLRDGARS